MQNNGGKKRLCWEKNQMERTSRGVLEMQPGRNRCFSPAGIIFYRESKIFPLSLKERGKGEYCKSNEGGLSEASCAAELWIYLPLPHQLVISGP